jgi:hypothetical protein
MYQERLFSRWSTLIFAGVISVLLGLALYQWIVGPIGSRPMESRYFAVMALLSLGMMLDFAWLTIRITQDGVIVGYGLVRRRVHWNDIEDCHADQASVVRYGGWGIRLGWYRGRRRLVYNIIGAPRVVLLTRNRLFPEFVFSTRVPETVVSVIREQLERRRSG